MTMFFPCNGAVYDQEMPLGPMSTVDSAFTGGAFATRRIWCQRHVSARAATVVTSITPSKTGTIRSKKRSGADKTGNETPYPQPGLPVCVTAGGASASVVFRLSVGALARSQARARSRRGAIQTSFMLAF
ncbi:MAG: hypothetical protein JWN27_3391 [Candidatus Eremiobacteraeota bacterium]|nr:hypothetical protein [Candidatus Eremiobacteraeota bacterium]